MKLNGYLLGRSFYFAEFPQLPANFKDANFLELNFLNLCIHNVTKLQRYFTQATLISSNCGETPAPSSITTTTILTKPRTSECELIFFVTYYSC